ncbi:hypothetical protein RDI58_003300 [Solanum bulbocastanum]|uniref:Uncharacterized protein n=1 Tax=Solanum bulbocastanum TaxID=147425 RepID=A0AAN8YRR8_SOLBU
MFQGGTTRSFSSLYAGLSYVSKFFLLSWSHLLHRIYEENIAMEHLSARALGHLRGNSRLRLKQDSFA